MLKYCKLNGEHPKQCLVYYTSIYTGKASSTQKTEPGRLFETQKKRFPLPGNGGDVRIQWTPVGKASVKEENKRNAEETSIAHIEMHYDQSWNSATTGNKKIDTGSAGLLRMTTNVDR